MKKIVLWLLLAGLLAFSAGSANALINLKYDPAYKYAGVGSLFEINILADIPEEDAIVAWGFTLEYDESLMTLQGVTGGPGWDIMQLSPGRLTGFLLPTPTSPPNGVAGPNTLIAIPEFECLGPGDSPIGMTINPDDPTQGFVKPDGTFAPWESTPGTVSQGVVPEPSTFLLLGSGIAGIAWLRRRKNRAS